MANIIKEILNHNVSQVSVMVNLDDLQKWGEELVDSALRKYVKKEESYLTPTEAQKLLKVARSTLYRWDKEGYLKAVRIGRKPRYKMSDVERLMATPPSISVC